MSSRRRRGSSVGSRQSAVAGRVPSISLLEHLAPATHLIPCVSSWVIIGRFHVWGEAHKLVLAVYRATRQFPREEIYGLSAQMRQAAISVPANLAEGCGRNSDREIARFARVSLGSASELEYYFILSAELGYLRHEEARSLRTAIHEIKSMLAALAASLSSVARLTTDD